MDEELLQQARTGNPEAIQRFLVAACSPMNWDIQTQFSQNILQVNVIGSLVPPQGDAVSHLRTHLTHLQLPEQTEVHLRGWRKGADFPQWQQRFICKNQQLSLKSNRTTSTIPKSTSSFGGISSLELKFFFPYQEAFSSKFLQDPTVVTLLFFGLLPLAVVLGVETVGLGSVAWVLGIYFAALWGMVFFYLIQPREFAWHRVAKAALFTTFIGIPILFIAQNIYPFNLIYSFAGVPDWSITLPLRLVGFILGVGLLEETCKATSVYLFFRRGNHLRQPLSYMFYGGMSGLGFAVAEGVLYTLAYGEGIQSGNLTLEQYTLITTVRFVSLPLFHAVWSGISGYFLGLSTINAQRQWSITGLGIGIAAILHGLYNTFSNSLIALFFAGFSIVLFVVYLRFSQEMITTLTTQEQKNRSRLG